MRGSHSSEWRLRSTERGCTDGCMRILPLIRRVPRQLPPRGKPKRRCKSDICAFGAAICALPSHSRSEYHAAPPHITAPQYHSPQANRTEKTVDFRQRFFLWRAWRDSGGDRARLRPAFFVSPPKGGRRFRCAKPQKTPAVCCILQSDGSNPCIAKQKTTRLGGFSLARLAGFEPATYRFVAGHSIH